MSKTYAIITGASEGIGLEFAKVLASQKYNLILVYSFSLDSTKPIGIEIPPGWLVVWDWIVYSTVKPFIKQAFY